MSPILNQAGGLRYLFRGLRYSRQNWAPFRESVGSWLAEKVPADQPLLLLGPSAGYCLSPGWLRNHRSSIEAVDWDPLAPFFFRNSHPGVDLRWHRADLIRDGGAALQKILERSPESSVLFCNFLGQAELASPQHYPVFARRLPDLLMGHRWLSFHDRYSGRIVPSRKEAWAHEGARPGQEQLLDIFYRSSSSGELIEHSLPPMPEQGDYRYWIWELSPGVFHLIEGFAQ